MTKKALVLHGWCGNSENNWFPWLKNEGEKKGYELIVPNLTHTNMPVLEEQLQDIEHYVNDLHDGDIIIGHSLGCQLAIHFTHKHNLKNLNLILVAPSYPGTTAEIGKEIIQEAYESLIAYNDAELQFKKLGNTHTIFLSEDDPFINLHRAEEYYCELENMEFVEFENRGHFNSKAGVFTLPEILEYII